MLSNDGYIRITLFKKFFIHYIYRCCAVLRCSCMAAQFLILLLELPNFCKDWGFAVDLPFFVRIGLLLLFSSVLFCSVLFSLKKTGQGMKERVFSATPGPQRLITYNSRSGFSLDALLWQRSCWDAHKYYASLYFTLVSTPDNLLSHSTRDRVPNETKPRPNIVKPHQYQRLVLNLLLHGWK